MHESHDEHKRAISISVENGVLLRIIGSSDEEKKRINRLDANPRNLLPLGHRKLLLQVHDTKGESR